MAVELIRKERTKGGSGMKKGSKRYKYFIEHKGIEMLSHAKAFKDVGLFRNGRILVAEKPGSPIVAKR